MGKAIPKIKEFPDDGRIWRVDWFGSIERNPQVPSEPKVQVIISPLVEGAKDFAAISAVKHEDRQTITVGVGQLPAISIGSLWKNRRCIPEVAGTEEIFSNLQINSQTVQLVRSDFKTDGDTLIKAQFHRVGVGLYANCLAIKLKDDPFGIIIPVIEIIRAYYAVSSKLSKAIFFGNFRHDIGSIINPELTCIDPINKHVSLRLRRDYSNEDGYFIARIIFDSIARNGANLVHDSTLRQSIAGLKWLHPESSFPFEGTTTLFTRAKRMRVTDEKWRYIVFAINKCSGEFPYKAITFDRDNNADKANEETDLPDELKTPAYPKKKPKDLGEADDELQSDDEPDADYQPQAISLPSSRFGALSEVKIEKVEKDLCNYISAGKVIGIDGSVDELGTGDGEHNNNNVRPVNIQGTQERQEPLPASFDTFRLMVTALNSGRCIASLRPQSDSISYIPLRKPKGMRQWSYLDSDLRLRRKVLVADISYQGRQSCLIEFQWRNGESFRLAVISAIYGSRLSDLQVRELLLLLAKKQGRWEHVKSTVGAIKIELLKHTWPDIPSYCRAVKDALA
ncbi:hypothetical protein [Cellvibrio sp. NN19]|uniref:hypothetical protein n=1 Tax=Cellvibrio chitinivorans TaxID=3102792 RepID=UPI002B400B78|nr:hypothetical protein [Cellvibrio sp. NN19]